LLLLLLLPSLFCCCGDGEYCKQQQHSENIERAVVSYATAAPPTQTQTDPAEKSAFGTGVNPPERKILNPDCIPSAKKKQCPPFVPFLCFLCLLFAEQQQQQYFGAARLPALPAKDLPIPPAQPPPTTTTTATAARAGGVCCSYLLVIEVEAAGEDM
jgi:hypothetical protein